MDRIKPVFLILALLLTPVLFFSTNALAEEQQTTPSENTVRVPIQGDLIQRLEKAGLQPSLTKKVEAPEGFKMPEVPKAIKNENLNPAGSVKMDQLERKRAEGKLTETEYNLEKDSLFREANLKY